MGLAPVQARRAQGSRRTKVLVAVLLALLICGAEANRSPKFPKSLKAKGEVLSRIPAFCVILKSLRRAALVHCQFTRSHLSSCIFSWWRQLGTAKAIKLGMTILKGLNVL